MVARGGSLHELLEGQANRRLGVQEEGDEVLRLQDAGALLVVDLPLPQDVGHDFLVEDEVVDFPGPLEACG